MLAENINITTTREKFFLEYLILKKPAIDSMLKHITGNRKATLSDKPMRVLAQLLYFNDEYKNIPEKDRSAQLFSREVKEMICDNLKMKEHHLNIYISQLRNLGILEGKNIKPIFVILADDRSLTFTFRLNGHPLKTN
ncbi:MAG: hypothetical protein UR43_C0022G0003 [candidate division TM6 bacterium GW2011_GWF2_33_332]|nr:MAG: hypothetical protein UR43_C0022G0003 [candidate division TM6 bacterium GW2011_GWF2_33_332]